MPLRLQTFNINVQQLEAETRLYYKKYQIAMTRLWKAGMRVFVEEVVVHMALQGIIDTGMSAGSLIPVAKEAYGTTGRTRAIINSAIKRKSAEGVYDISGSFDASGFRTVKAGEDIGEESETFQVDYGTVNRPYLSFNFNIRVFQYRLLESSPEWRTLERGEAAMVEFVRNNWETYLPPIVDLLNPSSYTTVT